MNETTQYRKGKKLYEGKTKKVYPVIGLPNNHILHNKIDITQKDDADLTRQFKNKAKFATTVTSNIFNLFKEVGIPVAYEKQISPVELLVNKCEMLLLEVVVRRAVVPGSSYLRRFPNLSEDVPFRFPKLVVEFNLKTTDGEFVGRSGKKLVEGLDNKNEEEDPLIINPSEKKWDLRHPKTPTWEKTSSLNRTVSMLEVIDSPERLIQMTNCARHSFLVTEGIFSYLGYRLIDWKIEFGLLPDGTLVIGDVIDPDSFRLTNWEWEDYSKETFRQGADLGDVERKYGIVAGLSQFFRIPRQALVIWKASPKDKIPEKDLKFIKENLPAGVNLVEHAGSGHKETRRSMNWLNEIQKEYPDGGVICPWVGRSNGLGPTLAPHTTWPVISTCATLKSYPMDIFSNVIMPSDNPHLTGSLDMKNSFLAALNILGQKNPAAYAFRQLAIEAMDD